MIDADLGLSAAAASHRQGFKDLVARVTLGEVGIIFIDRRYEIGAQLFGLVPAA